VDRILKTYKNPLQLEQFIMEGIFYFSFIILFYLFLNYSSFKVLPVSDHQFTPRGGDLPFKKDRGAHRTFQGLKKKQFWNLLGHLAPTGPPKKYLGDNVVFKNWYILGVKKISSHTHKTGSWYLLDALLKISDEHPCSFYIGVLLLGIHFTSEL